MNKDAPEKLEINEIKIGAVYVEISTNKKYRVEGWMGREGNGQGAALAEVTLSSRTIGGAGWSGVRVTARRKDRFLIRRNLWDIAYNFRRLTEGDI